MSHVFKRLPIGGSATIFKARKRMSAREPTRNAAKRLHVGLVALCRHVEAVKSYRGGAAEFAPAVSKVSANSQVTSSLLGLAVMYMAKPL